jgi:hypothetical protein
MAMPAAAVTACCSAMPTSKKRFGEAALEVEQPGRSRHRGGDRDNAFVGGSAMREQRGCARTCR